MDNIINFITNTKGITTSTPVLPELIVESQKLLRVRFSEDYKEMLLNFGALMYHGNTILGLNPEHKYDCVSVTIDMKEFDEDIPANMYVIMMADIDSLLFLQDECGNVYKHFPMQGFQLIANNLEDFLFTL